MVLKQGRIKAEMTLIRIILSVLQPVLRIDAFATDCIVAGVAMLFYKR